MSIGTLVLGTFRVSKYTFSLVVFAYLLLASPYHNKYLGRAAHKSFDDDIMFKFGFSLLLLGVHLPVGL